MRPDHPLGRFILIQAIRYLAASMAFPMVFFHAGWVLLAVATWGHAAAPDSAVAAVAQSLARAYAWLGGVDASGHGDEDGLMVVWAKLSLLVYAAESLWRWAFGERKPMRLARVAMLSTAVALVGYALAFAPTGELVEAAPIGVGFSILAGLATAWSMAMHRLAAGLELQVAGGARRASAAVGTP